MAAWELLDEEQPLLPTKSPYNDNAYTFSRIGNYNVIIVYLPKRRYGIILAASVAKNILRSFESIQIGLLVDIGEGVPSGKYNIRLENIIIGYPIKKEGSIVLYNFSKAV